MYEHIVDVRNRAIRIVSGRTIVQDNVGIDKLFATFDNVWDGCDIAVIFKNGEDTVRCKYTDGMDIPWEVIRNAGDLRLTFVGTQGDEIIVETELMRDIFKVKAAGVTDGADPESPTPTEYQSIMADVRSIRDGIRVAEEAAVKADTSAERADISTVNADEATEKANAAAKYADDTASGAAEATELANNAASYASASAQAADNAVSNIMHRVEAGEFNGAPFRFSYQVGSVAELDGITGQQKFDLAIINSSVEDPDNSKFYMWTGSEWHYENDLSGGAGIQGPQGVQGVSLKNVRVVDATKVEVTQYDPMTEQDRTYIIGDFADPLSTGIQTYVDSKFQVVDAIPDNPVEGVVYMVRM